MMAVDEILDRLVGDLFDFLDVGVDHLRPAIAERVGGDDAGARHDEHRLVVAGAEDVDLVGAFDPGGGVRRLLGRLLRQCGRTDDKAERGEYELLHFLLP